MGEQAMGIAGFGEPRHRNPACFRRGDECLAVEGLARGRLGPVEHARREDPVEARERSLTRTGFGLEAFADLVAIALFSDRGHGSVSLEKTSATLVQY